ncbi:hypothetical protein QBC36DRAFT_56482 [Triangularia setosa]|uniref:Uncharacterized protein n=1 Tax=Triangularia setosa TaxID=2587417 RepID=A0AAN6W1X5_9PEZI|nr:hypothetical protein QBC36DRAFT_56482 [Podospora setosa]
MASALETAVSRLMWREAALSRAGSLAALVVGLVAEAIPRLQCLDLWVLAGSVALVSAAASAVVSGAVIVDSEAVLVGSVVAIVVSVEVALAAVVGAPEVVTAALGVVIATLAALPTRLAVPVEDLEVVTTVMAAVMGLVVVVVVVVVGMVVAMAAHAHMMTDLAAAAAVFAIATLVNPEATWSPSDLVEIMVGTAATTVAATTTDRETTTSPASVGMKAVTRIPESFAGTRRKARMGTEIDITTTHQTTGISLILSITSKLALKIPTLSVSLTPRESCVATLNS